MVSPRDDAAFCEHGYYICKRCDHDGPDIVDEPDPLEGGDG